ncbi:hypothetical protein QTO34_001567 [Cnephaeus nilssonii]|uniref:Potassium channel domain-containing protein n=1 Tax=Cnephaeus nilssonii TaxID=3371016 RepID=A0AA40HWW9_CNENI|nr:hypothetical protein QTO34_001567 [Eptesicus nilssonii]
MAPQAGRPVCPPMCGPRARAASQGRARRCALPGTVLLLLAYLAYLALGTGVFWMLESPAAQASKARFKRDKWALLRNFTCLDGPALDSLIRGIIHAYQTGTSSWATPPAWGAGRSWAPSSFPLGNLSPHTMAARLFCIFFALVGIPLNLVVLNHLGHLMQQGVHRCARRLGGAWQDPAKARWLTGSGALLSGLLLFLLLPPLLFSHMEGWSYVEGFYFAFITLSTVGFGDYVIGMDPSRQYPLWYKNTVSLWILFGMAWLALIIKLILSLMETRGRSYSCCHHSSRGDFKPRSWRQGPEGEAEPHSPRPGCYPEGPVGARQHSEASTQVSRYGKQS